MIKKYYEKIPFLEDYCAGIYLIPKVESFEVKTFNRKNEIIGTKIISSQNLIMEYKTKGRRKVTGSINCIHNALATYNISELSKTKLNTDKVLQLRNMESVKEIHLEPEEKYKAFRLWVKGIAELGLESLVFQQQVEEMGQIAPISNRILLFLTNVSLDFLGYYLDLLKRKCRFLGKQHKPSLLAGFINVVNLMKYKINIVKIKHKKAVFYAPKRNEIHSKKVFEMLVNFMGENKFSVDDLDWYCRIKDREYMDKTEKPFYQALDWELNQRKIDYYF